MAVLVLSLLLVLATATVLVGTSPGLSWLLERSADALPGRLELASIEGGLLGELRLTNLRYAETGMQIGAEELYLRWAPGALLAGRLHVQELALTQPFYTASAADRPEAGASPVVLPDLALPLELQLDRVAVKRLAVRSAPDAEPTELTRLLLAAAWERAGIRIETLELDMAGVKVRADGELQPQGDYRLELRTDVSLALEGVPQMQAQGRIYGSIETLLAEQLFSGDVQGRLQAQVDKPLGQAAWRADLVLDALALQSLVADMPGKVAGELKAQGDLNGMQTEGRLRLPEGESYYAPWQAELKGRVRWDSLAAEVQRLVVTRPDTPLELTLSGRLDAQAGYDLRADWKALQWPLDGEGVYTSAAGELSFRGQVDDYALALRASLAGKDLPQGGWSLDGRGSAAGLQIEPLRAEILGGTLAAKGRLDWSPALRWDVQLDAAKIDPGGYDPQWPGALDASLRSRGSMETAGLRWAVVIERLQGMLRERPVSGSGELAQAGKDIEVKNLHLRSGAAEVRANGRMGSRSDLSWRLAVSDLADLLPGGHGRIDGEGSVSGPMELPRIQGRLEAAGLGVDGNGVETLSADIELDLADRQASRLDLHASHLSLAGESLPSFRVEAAGRMAGHRGEVKAEHAAVTAELAFAGAYAPGKTAWIGKLQDASLRTAEFGEWRQGRPAALKAAPGVLELGEWCLARSEAALCAEAKLKQAKGGGKLAARGIDLDWFLPLLPPAVEKISATLGLEADFTLGERPLLNSRLTLSKGEVIVHPPGEEAIHLLHEGAHAKVAADAKRLAGDLRWDIGDDVLSGHFEVPRPALDKDPATAPLSGSVNLQFRQLQLLAGLIPMVEKLAGEMRVDLDLGGRLGDPTVKGEAALSLPALRIADAGLDLKRVEMKAISPDGRKVRLDGGADSGSARLVLGGDLELDAAKSWPLALALKAKDFQVLNLPDKTASINADLAFEHRADGMLLSGELTVPHAYVELDELPESGAAPSPDVVIVKQGEALALPEKGAPFAMKLTLGLGSDVRFRGFGLNAYLEGRVTVSQLPGEFPTGSGELQVKEGTYKAYGQNLLIKRGIVSYSGGRIDNPGLNIRAAREAEVDLGNGNVSVTAGVDVTGTARKPRVTVFSDPALEQRDAISVMLTGNTARNLGKGGGSIGVGTQVTRDLSVGARYDPSTSKTEIVTKYRFNRKIHVEASTGADSNAADVFYSLEFE